MNDNSKHINLMRQAIELSRKTMHENSGGPFGAVIAKNGTVIAHGVNRVISANDPTAHAEIVAIRAACQLLETFHLDGCVIYTSCQPCPMCLSAIYWARIEKVFYANTCNDAAHIGFNDDVLYDELAKPLSQRTKPMEQLLHDEALLAFQEWQNKDDKMLY